VLSLLVKLTIETVIPRVLEMWLAILSLVTASMHRQTQTSPLSGAGSGSFSMLVFFSHEAPHLVELCLRDSKLPNEQLAHLGCVLGRLG